MLNRSTLKELNISGVQLQDSRDWVLIAENMDWITLTACGPREISVSHLLSPANAVGRYISTIKTTKLEEEASTMVVASFWCDFFLHFELDLAGHLHFIRTPFDSNHPGSFIKALASFSSPSLKSLTIHGDSIEKWIPPLAFADAPRLQNLGICGAASVSQELSRSSALTFLQLIAVSSLRELRIENVQFQDRRDWELVAKVIDYSLIKL